MIKSHWLIFTVICALASLIGLTVMFLFGAFIDFLMVSKWGINVTAAIGVTLSILGLILPPIVLFRARRRQREPHLTDKEIAIKVSISPPETVLNEGLSIDAAPPSLNLSNDDNLNSSHVGNHAILPLPNIENATEMSRIGTFYSSNIRIIDWNYLLISLIPIIITILTVIFQRGKRNPEFDSFALTIVGLLTLPFALLEMVGTSFNGSKFSYYIRIQIYGSYAVPIWRRTLDLSDAWEASANTLYRSRKSIISRQRLIFITGDFGQATLWCSTKGYRDWTFAIIKKRAPHVRQFRGRY